MKIHPNKLWVSMLPELKESAVSESKEEVKETKAPKVKKEPVKKPSAKSASKPKVEVAAQKAVLSKIIAKESEVRAVEEPVNTKKKTLDKKKQEAQKAAEALEAEKRKAEEEARDKAKAEEEAAARKKAEEAKRKAQQKADAKSKFSSLFNKSGKDSASKGQATGHPDAKALEGLSSGKGTAGKGFGDRGIVYSPTITDDSQRTGRVVVDICVNKKGEVISAKFTQKGSTTTDAYLIDLAEKSAKKYKFMKSEVEEQCGEITIDFKLK